MNAARILLAAVIVVGLVSTAKAVNMVWWEAEPMNGDSFVIQQGEGLNLELQCGLEIYPLPMRCEWNITMYLRNDQGISGWANDLGTMPDDDSMSVEGFEYMTWYQSPKGLGYYYPFDYVNYAATTGSGDALLTNTAAFRLGTIGPPLPQYYPNGYPLLRFTLSKDKTPEWVPGWTDIHTTGSDLGEWDATWYSIIQFGDNPPIWNFPGNSPAGPVISVFNIPEPATITLLGLGALLLARRRTPARTPGAPR
jgi:hypothetical protein